MLCCFVNLYFPITHEAENIYWHLYFSSLSCLYASFACVANVFMNLINTDGVPEHNNKHGHFSQIAHSLGKRD
jgi:hypothetical protein